MRRRDQIHLRDWFDGAMLAQNCALVSSAPERVDMVHRKRLAPDRFYYYLLIDNQPTFATIT